MRDISTNSTVPKYSGSKRVDETTRQTAVKMTCLLAVHGTHRLSVFFGVSCLVLLYQKFPALSIGQSDEIGTSFLWKTTKAAVGNGRNAGTRLTWAGIFGIMKPLLDPAPARRGLAERTVSLWNAKNSAHGWDLF